MEKYVIDGYSFRNKTDFERAQKEKETIAYLLANSNSADMKELLKIYNRSIEKKSFQTVFGLEFLQNIRKRLIGSGIVTEDTLNPVPVGSARNPSGGSGEKSGSDTAALVKHYKEAYESARAGRIIKNILIAVLIFVIAAMMVITYRSEYSVFTFFTDYKENMRNELVDEYESWEIELNNREKELDQREKQLDRNDSNEKGKQQGQ